MRSRHPTLFLVVLAGVILLTPACGWTGESADTNATPSATSPLTESDIRTMLRDYIDADQLGVAMAIGAIDTRGRQVVGYGKLDNGTDREVDGNTVFEIGSITKVFTALLLQDMVERGQMRLDDPAQNYLPDSVKMPIYQGRPITLLHLATHTSGLPPAADNLLPPTWRNPDPQDVYTAEQLYSFLNHHRLKRAPGLTEEYSNLGMQLLGHLITRKAGQDYESLVVERICRPLNMDSTRVNLTPELTSRLALGHRIPSGRAPRMKFVLPGAGGLCSTANDLLSFVAAYAGVTSSPLSSLLEKAREFHSMESGGKLMLAWGSKDAFFGHVGGTYGYEAVVAFDPKVRRGIVVLSSCRSSGLTTAITGPLWDDKSPKPPSSINLDTSLLDRCTGQYRLKKGGICTARREGDRLLLQWGASSLQRSPSYEVFPQPESLFRNEFWGVEARFSCPDKGKARGLVLTSLGPHSGFKDPLILKKISNKIPERPAPIPLDSQRYRNYVGQYRKTLLFGLLQLGPSLSIFQESDDLGNHLIARAHGVPGYTEADFIPVGETTFVVNPMSTSDDIRLTFTRPKPAKTTRIQVFWNGKKLQGSRISDSP